MDVARLTDPKSYPFLASYTCPLLFVTISGSHLYGFPSEDSDVDLRGSHVAWTRDVVGLHPARETIEYMGEGDNPADVVTHEVAKFIRIAIKNSGYALEQAFSPLVVIAHPRFEELRALLRRAVTRAHLRHYQGFTNQQLALLRRRPDKEVKIILYVFRPLLTGLHFARSGEIEPNLRKLNEVFRLDYIDELIAQKVEGKEHGLLPGGHNLEFYYREFERLYAEMEEAASRAPLPDTSDVIPELNDYLISLRKSYFT